MIPTSLLVWKTHARYLEIEKKHCVMERALRPRTNQMLNPNFPIEKQIVDRKWEQFTNQQKNTILEFVKEFYANAYGGKENDIVMVRGNPFHSHMKQLMSTMD